jgi:hypothetical protein
MVSFYAHFKCMSDSYTVNECMNYNVSNLFVAMGHEFDFNFLVLERLCNEILIDRFF